jgi:hypothetical protein
LKTRIVEAVEIVRANAERRSVRLFGNDLLKRAAFVKQEVATSQGSLVADALRGQTGGLSKPQLTGMDRLLTDAGVLGQGQRTPPVIAVQIFKADIDVGGVSVAVENTIATALDVAHAVRDTIEETIFAQTRTAMAVAMPATVR